MQRFWIVVSFFLAGSTTLGAQGVAPKVAEAVYSPQLVDRLVAEAMTHGDARRGAVVFGLSTSACSSCHKVGTHGGTVGPELSKISLCLKPAQIVEALYWPGRTVKPEHRAVAVELASGKIVQGVLKQESTAGIVLVDALGKTHQIRKAAIEDRRDIGSLMPAGLTAAMTEEQRRDLVRYLFSLGRTKGLEMLSHEPAAFKPKLTPLVAEHWPNASARVNRDRVYDYYTREAAYFRKQTPVPLMLPEWPGLDGGSYGHWGNQNDTVWEDGRWNDTDLGTLQAGIFRAGKLLVPRAVCVRLGDAGEMSACFNPETLQIETVWKGGFLKFSDRRHGFLGGLSPAGTLQKLPAAKKHNQPFVYRGFYRDGKRVVFAYRLGDVEMLDAPWCVEGKLTREVGPVERHSMRHVLKGGKAQWPQAVETAGALGRGGPYAIDTIAPPFKNPWKALQFFGGHDFFADGSAVICTMQGDVWHVTGLDASLKQVRWRRFASGLHHALGLLVVDGVVYVQGRDQITRLHDRNGDGEADFYESFSRAFITSSAGHDFICGLERDAAGNFYTASGNQGLLRISPDGNKAEVLATGFRNPDGLGVLPDGSVTVPCSEGQWTPASMICEARPSLARTQYFGYGGPRGNKPPDLPLVYLPRGLDNSAGGQLVVNSDRWGPLKNQLLHFSFGAARHFLILRDEVDGQPQGAAVPLVGDFRSGTHRGRFNPKDGQLYVSGMDGWGSYAVEDGCFQRVRYTGAPVQLPAHFHVHRNGILLTFTAPLNKSHVEQASNHFAQAWNYRYSQGYGSREFSPSHYGVAGHDPVVITSAHVLDDGKSLFLEMPDLQPVNQLHLQIGLEEGVVRDVFATVHKLDAPFRNLPNYREVTRPIAVHPILRDLAAAVKPMPNPWTQPIAKAREIAIQAGKNLTYSATTLRAKPGEVIKLTFRNPDVVPHNWVLARPGTLPQVGKLANLLIADADAFARHYIPRSDDVLFYTSVIEGGQSTSVYFRLPAAEGRYPYLCTLPGHWMVMNGELIVEK